MRRREFVFFLGGVAALPAVARAQQPEKPVIGFLCGKSPQGDADQLASVWRGLKDMGFVEGKNVGAEYRWAQSQYGRFPALSADLIVRGVNVIAAIGTTPAALAAKAATKTIPIVFIIGTDPIAVGLVPSLNRPGGNVTGVTFLNRTLVVKQFEFLHDIAPAASSLGFLVNPNNPFAEDDTKEATAAIQKLGLKLLVAKAGKNDELTGALDRLVQQHAGGFVVAGDLFLNTQQDAIIAYAASHRMPAVYPWREAVAGGGLMSYGASRTEAYEQAGRYIGRILNGERSANLPVQQVTKVEFVINQKTAQNLGINFPLPLVGRADEVIE